jgi:hypothetical protein
MRIRGWLCLLVFCIIGCGGMYLMVGLAVLQHEERRIILERATSALEAVRH